MLRGRSALWRGHLRNILPARNRLSIRHQPAMPYEEVPFLMNRWMVRRQSPRGPSSFLFLRQGVQAKSMVPAGPRSIRVEACG